MAPLPIEVVVYILSYLVGDTLHLFQWAHLSKDMRKYIKEMSTLSSVLRWAPFEYLPRRGLPRTHPDAYSIRLHSYPPSDREYTQLLFRPPQGLLEEEIFRRFTPDLRRWVRETTGERGVKRMDLRLFTSGLIPLFRDLRRTPISHLLLSWRGESQAVCHLLRDLSVFHPLKSLQIDDYRWNPAVLQFYFAQLGNQGLVVVPPEQEMPTFIHYVRCEWLTLKRPCFLRGIFICDRLSVFEIQLRLSHGQSTTVRDRVGELRKVVLDLSQLPIPALPVIASLIIELPHSRPSFSLKVVGGGEPNPFYELRVIIVGTPAQVGVENRHLVRGVSSLWFENIPTPEDLLHSPWTRHELILKN